MNPTITTEILFAATEVAQALGVKLYDLQKLHPDDFGVPGHWRMLRGSVVVYTERGALGLADVVERRAQLGAPEEREALLALVHSFRVLVRQRVETPSRTPAKHGSWLNRADLQ